MPTHFSIFCCLSGVNIEHEDLEGRARWGKTIPDDPDQDLNGHGSHVAGTIAGKTYGVAKNATIIAVKVLGAGGKSTHHQLFFVGLSILPTLSFM
jgi:subtilisin family serine protease